MKSNCRCRRIVGPFGSWSYKDIIGAQVKVKSMPVSNFLKGFDADQVYTVKDIIFRVSMDGKTISVVILEENPDIFFTWKDLEVIGIKVKDNEESEESELNQTEDNEDNG